MNYTVESKTVESQPLAVVKRRARQDELSKVVPEACGIVWDAVKALQLKGGRHVAIYWNQEIDLEVGVEIDAAFAGRGDVVRSATPAGAVLTTAHIGMYDRIGDAHRAIADWSKQHQMALAGPNWEIYGHWTEDLSQLRTDVFYLLK
jgi:effector-binding domain-containing protein